MLTGVMQHPGGSHRFKKLKIYCCMYLCREILKAETLQQHRATVEAPAALCPHYHRADTWPRITLTAALEQTALFLRKPCHCGGKTQQHPAVCQQQQHTWWMWHSANLIWFDFLWIVEPHTFSNWLILCSPPAHMCVCLYGFVCACLPVLLCVSVPDGLRIDCLEFDAHCWKALASLAN